MNRETSKAIKLLALGLLVASLGVWWLLTPKPQRVRPANVNSNSFSVGFFTDRKSKSCVLAIRDIKKMDWLKTCEEEKSQTHLVEIEGAESGESYQLVLIDLPKITFKKLVAVRTPEISDQPPGLPEPAFGTVLGQNDQPVPEALIYISAQSSEFSYPVAALTNEAGNFAVDMGPNIHQADKFLLDAVADAGIWMEKLVSGLYKTPLPSITVRVK